MNLAERATALLLRLTRASLRHAGAFALTALVLMAVCCWLASGLEVRTSFEELLPSDVPSAANVKELVRRVGGDGTVYVVVESLDGPSGLKSIEAMGTTLTADLLAMGPRHHSNPSKARSPTPRTISPITGRCSCRRRTSRRRSTR